MAPVTICYVQAMILEHKSEIALILMDEGSGRRQTETCVIGLFAHKGKAEDR
jgi:hypothetical protein